MGNRGHRLTDTSLAWNEGPASTFQRLAQQGVAQNYVCSPADAAQYGVPYPSWEQLCIRGNFCASTLAAISPYPQLADAENNYWGYANLLYVGLPLGQSFYDSMVVDVVKRTGRGLTMDMSYTWSRQEGIVPRNRKVTATTRAFRISVTCVKQRMPSRDMTWLTL